MDKTTMIDIKKIIAGDSPVSEPDVRIIKHALNRLGYYWPFEAVGMNGIPDAQLFEGIKAFQVKYALPATAEIRPGDETIQLINKAMKEAPDGQYIWRTVGDDKVRDSHAALEGSIRSYSQSPNPTEEINCRCWAEPVEPGFRNGKFPVPEPPDNPNYIDANAGTVVFNGVRITATACWSIPACRAWFLRESAKIILENIYHPPPKTLPGFPDAKKIKEKGPRRRWIDSKGKIYEWDSQHGEVEIYDKTGKKHEGSFDPETGEKIKEGKPGRRTEK